MILRMEVPALKHPILTTFFFNSAASHIRMSNQNVSNDSKAILQLLQRISEFCGFVSG